MKFAGGEFQKICPPLAGRDERERRDLRMEGAGRVKSRRFAVRVILLYRELCRGYREYELFRQLLRSGTSIGANIAEAECAMSSRDFVAKIYIALKECSETAYWLELLHETGYIVDCDYNSLMDDCLELRRILSATTKTIEAKHN